MYNQKPTTLGKLKPGDKFHFDCGEMAPYELLKHEGINALVVKPSGRKDWFNSSNEVFIWTKNLEKINNHE